MTLRLPHVDYHLDLANTPWRVRSVHLTEQVDAPFDAALHLLTTVAVAPSDLLLAPATITIRRGDTTRTFRGEVTRARVVEGDAGVDGSSVEAASVEAATTTERVPVSEVIAVASAAANEAGSPTIVDVAAPASGEGAGEGEGTRVAEIDAVPEAARTGMPVIVAAPRVDPALLAGPTRAEVLTRLASLENPDAARGRDVSVSATSGLAAESTSRSWVPWALGAVLIAGVVTVMAWPDSPPAVEPAVTATEPASVEPLRPSKAVGPSEATPVAGASVGVQPVVPEPEVPAAEPEVPSPSPTVPSSIEEGGGEAGEVPEPEPVAPKAVPKPKPKVVPTPAVDDAKCEATRDEAERARAGRDSSTVIEKTSSKRCWPDATARLRLRVPALFALARYEDCVREGKSSSDERVVRFTEQCRRKLDTP
jgi:hypothetical protein